MQQMPDVGFTWVGAIILVWVVAFIVGLALFLWALIDCVMREFKDSTTKIVWVLVILLVSVIGPIIYLIVGRPMGTKGAPGAAGPPQTPPSPS